eukprot:tig00000692_g3277.t1
MADAGVDWDAINAAVPRRFPGAHPAAPPMSGSIYSPMPFRPWGLDPHADRYRYPEGTLLLRTSGVNYAVGTLEDLGPDLARFRPSSASNISMVTYSKRKPFVNSSGRPSSASLAAAPKSLPVRPHSAAITRPYRVAPAICKDDYISGYGGHLPAVVSSNVCGLGNVEGQHVARAYTYLARARARSVGRVRGM